jgi:hypothetical protein
MSPEPGFGLIEPAFGFTSNSNNNRRGNPRQKSVRAGKYDNQWLVSDSPSEFAVAAVLREGRVEGVLAGLRDRDGASPRPSWSQLWASRHRSVGDREACRQQPFLLDFHFSDLKRT